MNKLLDKPNVMAVFERLKDKYSCLFIFLFSKIFSPSNFNSTFKMSFYVCDKILMNKNQI